MTIDTHDIEETLRQAAEAHKASHPTIAPVIEEASIATPLLASVSGKALIDALNVLAPAIAKRSTLPILSNVKITSFPGGLSLEATNLETYIQVEIPATVKRHGAITTNYKELVTILKPLGKKDITLEVTDAKLEVRTASMVLPLATMPAEDFPLMAAFTVCPIQTVEMPVDTFKACIGQVAYAAARDESRPVFCGVNITMEHDWLTFTTADKFRLSTIRHEVFGADSWKQALLLSAQALSLIAKKLPKTGTVTLSGDGGSISKIAYGKVAIFQRIIEGNYPNFEMIIPPLRDRKASITVSSAALVDVLISLGSVAKDNANIVKIVLEGDTLHLEAIRDGMDEPMTASVDGGSASGEITFKVNYAYLKEACAGSVYTTLTFSDATRPVKITSPDVPGWTGVIMPMHENR